MPPIPFNKSIVHVPKSIVHVPRRSSSKKARRDDNSIVHVPRRSSSSKRTKRDEEKMSALTKILMGAGVAGIPLGGYGLYKQFAESETDVLSKARADAALMSLLEGRSEVSPPTFDGGFFDPEGVGVRGTPTVDDQLAEVLSREDRMRLQQMGGQLQQSRRQLLAEMGVLI